MPPKMKRFEIYVPPGLLSELERIAQAEDASVSGVCREILHRSIAARRWPSRQKDGDE